MWYLWRSLEEYMGPKAWMAMSFRLLALQLLTILFRPTSYFNFAFTFEILFIFFVLVSICPWNILFCYKIHSTRDWSFIYLFLLNSSTIIRIEMLWVCLQYLFFHWWNLVENLMFLLIRISVWHYSSYLI